MAAGNVPEDLLTEILLRIPVKSLLRFRCVHKTWYSLFKSSSFITTHFQNPKNKDRGFIFFKHRGGLQFKLLTRDTFEVYSDLTIPFFAFRVVGSCNGLLCLYDVSILEGKKIYLYNPCLKQHNIIPQSTVSPPHDVDPIDKALGFGYDSINNDFKVVRVVSGRSKHEEGKLVDSSQAQVYSLRMNCWRKVGILPDVKFKLWAHQAVLNGAIHWLGHRNKINIVISFDISNEVFKLFPIIDCVGEACLDMKIDVYGDLLCVVKCVVRDCWCYDIWTIGEYGVEESWTRVQAFKLFKGGVPPRFLGFGMNKVLLLEDYKGIIVYYPDKGAFKEIEASIGMYPCSILNFTESLVSPEEYNK